MGVATSTRSTLSDRSMTRSPVTGPSGNCFRSSPRSGIGTWRRPHARSGVYSSSRSNIVGDVFSDYQHASAVNQHISIAAGHLSGA
jgi:hypothetical protein